MGWGSNEELLKVMNQLYFYLIKIGADEETAKDIVQESVYKSMIYIESIDTNKYKAWLFKVAINFYYDYCRKIKKSQSVQLVDEHLVTSSTLMEDMMIEKENKEQVRIALENLSFTYKQLLLLKYEMEWSYQQIAEYLDMKPNGVKTYLARARAKFKEIYLEGRK